MALSGVSPKYLGYRAKPNSTKEPQTLVGFKKCWVNRGPTEVRVIAIQAYLYEFFLAWPFTISIIPLINGCASPKRLHDSELSQIHKIVL